MSDIILEVIIPENNPILVEANIDNSNTIIHESFINVQGHNNLIGRENADCHPIGAITGLSNLLVGLNPTDNNFTDEYKNKLDNIESGADVNVNADWTATSGDAQILNKPDVYTKTEADNKYELKLPGIPVNPETKFLNANKEWADISIGNGGYAANIYFSTGESDISGYYKIGYTFDTFETILNAPISNEEILLRSYIYDDPIGITTIDAGNWVASFSSKVSVNTGLSYIKAEAFLRHVDNTETTLFSAYSPEINNTDFLVIKTESNQPSFSCLATDRLGVRVYGKSDTSVIISTIVGDGRASYFTAPIRLRHSHLRDLNSDHNYLHVTNDEKTSWNNKLSSYSETDPIFASSPAYDITSDNMLILNNTSGINTGDQDLSNLATKTELQKIKNLAIAMAVAL